MKKFLIYFIMLICTSCSCKKDPPRPECTNPPCITPVPTNSSDASTPTDIPLIVNGDDWELTLPSEAWVSQNISQEEIKFIATNSLKNNLIFVLKESFPGTYEEYVLASLRGVREQGSTLVSARQVKINNIKWVMVESFKEDIKVWQWVTFRNGVGYAFACGGSEALDQYDLCQQIANSLKLM